VLIQGFVRRARIATLTGMDSSPSSTAFVLSGGGVATVRELAEIWIGLRRGTVFPLNPLTGLFGFAGRRGYMVPDSGLRA
jgi:hypothetical protein